MHNTWNSQGTVDFFVLYTNLVMEYLNLFVSLSFFMLHLQLIIQQRKISEKTLLHFILNKIESVSLEVAGV